ncbi:uncharacterized protein E5676_scaffold5463G00140 [Cucumis melo var. makuwa]|uniref:DUF8039 domain-containing protein n=1 Tax=Cucumis melo var. makuwa TaxID=1194695 RepID=A0A5A7V1X6_CUCMM|nr:uncharacterized protein E6C27_scaffold455G00910 [Cucumis melo var. makuwa]TYK09383.1 uncharacterized protein E5676_scaffold5463G00140 [Cucumis melo var. makuwa]
MAKLRCLCLVLYFPIDLLPLSFNSCFDLGNVDLGTACGKYYHVSCLSIIDLDVENVVELNEEIKVNIAKDDEQMEGVTLEKMKVATPCKLAFEMKDHVVAWGTIFDSTVEGDNVKVAVDVVVDRDCAIPIPSEQGMYKMSQEVESHILWPRYLIITNNIKMDYGEFTKDMTTFAPTPIQNAPVAL